MVLRSLLLILLCSTPCWGQEVKVTVSGNPVELFDFVNVTLEPKTPPSGTPFQHSLEVLVTGPDGRAAKLAGFCVSIDGTRYRFRFMPRVVGKHRIKAQLELPGKPVDLSFDFTATASRRPGPVRVDTGEPAGTIRGLDNGCHRKS